MFRTKTKAELAKEKAERARERAQELAQERAADLSVAASERFQAAREAARDTAGPALAEAAEAARLKLAAAREAAGPVMHDLADRAKPRVEAAQSTLFDDMLPKLGAVLAAAAASLAEASEHAKESAGPRVEHAREEAHVYNDRARDALRVFRGEAVAVAPKRSKAPLLIDIGLAAAAVAAVAAYRQKQQAEDPWATPLTDSSMQPTFKEKAAEKVEQAKEVVSDTAAKAKDMASDLAAKGQAAVADAKDRSGEDSSTLESAFDDSGLGDTRASAVEGLPGSGTTSESTQSTDALVESLQENAAQTTAEGPDTPTTGTKRTTKSPSARAKSDKG
jgi:hypothetical protein